MANAKKILIESETTEIYRLRITGTHTVRSYCQDCGAIEEMVELNTACDISGAPARDLLKRVESGDLHSPETSSGHLLICRGSLERTINSDKHLRRGQTLLKESL